MFNNTYYKSGDIITNKNTKTINPNPSVFSPMCVNSHIVKLSLDGDVFQLLTNNEYFSEYIKYENEPDEYNKWKISKEYEYHRGFVDSFKILQILMLDKENALVEFIEKDKLDKWGREIIEEIIEKEENGGKENE